MWLWIIGLVSLTMAFIDYCCCAASARLEEKLEEAAARKKQTGKR